ncbi:hypothetical protein EDB19DRAFT_1632775, partial [Suillus lakei]
KLIAHFQNLPSEKRPQIRKASTSASETTFNALTLKTHQPYWILHQGNCEHFFVIDQIRQALLAHALDPPIRLSIDVPTNPNGSRSLSCLHSIVGDMRLGESPCLLCAPCWRTVGPPKNDESVMAVPLVIPFVNHWESRLRPEHTHCRRDDVGPSYTNKSER